MLFVTISTNLLKSKRCAVLCHTGSGEIRRRLHYTEHDCATRIDRIKHKAGNFTALPTTIKPHTFHDVRLLLPLVDIKLLVQGTHVSYQPNTTTRAATQELPEHPKTISVPQTKK